jgi:hypothetical protein
MLFLVDAAQHAAAAALAMYPPMLLPTPATAVVVLLLPLSTSLGCCSNSCIPSTFQRLAP